MAEVLKEGTIVLDTSDDIEFFKLLQAIGRLSLEVQGLKFRQSTLAAVKRYYSITAGTKAKALKELEQMRDDVKAGKKKVSELRAK